MTAQADSDENEDAIAVGCEPRHTHCHLRQGEIRRLKRGREAPSEGAGGYRLPARPSPQRKPRTLPAEGSRGSRSELEPARTNSTPPAPYFTDVIRAMNLPANPPWTKGSATTAMKPANRIHAIGFMSRQERRSSASTANEKRSRQSGPLVGHLPGGDARVFWVDSAKELATGSDEGCFTNLGETGEDKTVCLIMTL